MRDDLIKAARKIVSDPYILVNIVSLRVKQLRHGSRPLVESLESLALEDVALREIAEGHISYELPQDGAAGSEIAVSPARTGRSAQKGTDRKRELSAR